MTLSKVFPTFLVFQGFLMTYFDWTCVAWICVITANMYRLVKEEISFESSESLFHLACWFLPGIIAGVPFIWDAYGHSGPWWLVTLVFGLNYLD